MDNHSHHGRCLSSLERETSKSSICWRKFGRHIFHGLGLCLWFGLGSSSRPTLTTKCTNSGGNWATFFLPSTHELHFLCTRAMRGPAPFWFLGLRSREDKQFTGDNDFRKLKFQLCTKSIVCASAKSVVRYHPPTSQKDKRALDA